MSNKTYRIVKSEAAGGESIQCLLCGRVSHHPGDVAHRFCGACHTFLDEPIWRAGSGMRAAAEAAQALSRMSSEDFAGVFVLAVVQSCGEEKVSDDEINRLLKWASETLHRVHLISLTIRGAVTARWLPWEDDVGFALADSGEDAQSR